ncbi:hypothetical protein [Nocardia vinacea]|uniref:hypothetical protein n=1 Tax=Nocardia vinacea TaxID=96468 RepID=UPI0002F3752B|nr:hypothetical protein [Nocardia vinacea]
MPKALPMGGPAQDAAYGGDSKFRTWLNDDRIGYVVAVPSGMPIVRLAGDSRIDRVVSDAPTDA